MTVPRSILLRAHSGPEVGMGHVMRTRAVARACARLGGTVRLVVDDARTRELLGPEPYAVRVAGEAEEADAPDVLWLDGFLPWQRELEWARAEGTRVFLVENRVADRERAERVVYPALHFVPDGWDASHPERVLAGAGVVPLDEALVETAPAEERDVDLLVTFGGSDPKRLTERVLGLLGGRRGHLVVGIGHHMAHRAEGIRRRAEGLATRDLRVNVLAPGTALAPWMARSRAALTALGTTLYELAYLGVPAWILANYPEDRPALAWYDEHGPHRSLGVHADLSDEVLRARLGEVRAGPPCARPAGLGDGATRIARALLAA